MRLRVLHAEAGLKPAGRQPGYGAERLPVVSGQLRGYVYVVAWPDSTGMKAVRLRNSQLWGLVLGIAVAVMSVAMRIPAALAVAIGIIFGVVGFFVLDEKTKH